MSNANILITAATGLTGHAVLVDLLKKEHSVRSLAHREDDRSRSLEALGAEVVFGDFNDFSSMKAALHGIKRAYFCYPISKGLVQATAQFGQAAKDSGVEVIATCRRKLAAIMRQAMLLFEHWLSKRVLDWTGLAVTHLRPPFFAEWLLLFSQMIRQGNVYAPFAQGKTAFIAAADLSRVISSIAYHLVPFAVMRENIAANSVTTGQNNALSGYGESNRPEGSGDPHIFEHLQAAHQDFENGLFRGLNHDVERITGTTPISVEQFIAAQRAAFV